jgi:hypothetical protein
LITSGVSDNSLTVYTAPDDTSDPTTRILSLFTSDGRDEGVKVCNGLGKCNSQTGKCECAFVSASSLFLATSTLFPNSSHRDGRWIHKLANVVNRLTILQIGLVCLHHSLFLFISSVSRHRSLPRCGVKVVTARLVSDSKPREALCLCGSSSVRYQVSFSRSPNPSRAVAIGLQPL